MSRLDRRRLACLISTCPSWTVEGGSSDDSLQRRHCLLWKDAPISRMFLDCAMIVKRFVHLGCVLNFIGFEPCFPGFVAYLSVNFSRPASARLFWFVFIFIFDFRRNNLTFPPQKPRILIISEWQTEPEGRRRVVIYCVFLLFNLHIMTAFHCSVSYWLWVFFFFFFFFFQNPSIKKKKNLF